MNHDQLKIFGERVALVQIEEAVEGEILIPEAHKPNATYELGRVIGVGDGTQVVSKGEIVMFQYPQILRVSSTYKFDKEKVAVVSAGDIIAHLKSNQISMDTFAIAGNWVLLRIYQNKMTTLHLPDGVVPSPDEFRFTVEQIGNTIKDPIYKVGDEVLIQRTRASQLFVGKSEFAFVDVQHILGMVDGTDLSPELSKKGGMIVSTN